MLHAGWNVGDEIWFYTAIVIGAICLIAIILGLLGEAKWNADGIGFLSAIIGAVVGLVVLAISLFAFFPYNSIYMQYRPVSGVVTANVQSRFLADGQGTTQNFLVYINGNPYRCDDTRCSGLTKGMKVTLMCEKQYQFNASSGWVCNWGKLGLNN